MSRFEGKFASQLGESADAAEILAALAKDKEAEPEERRRAVSRYLSAGEGWREASAALGGAFAKPASWLKEDKDR